MPVPKDKIVLKLNEKYKGQSLSKDFKVAFANNWADTIETEEDIDEFISSHDFSIKSTISEADRRATLAVKTAKEDVATAITGKKPERAEPATPQVPDDTPEWAKGMIAQFQTVTQKVAQMEAEKGQQSLYERFVKQDSVKNLPKALVDKFAPKTEEEFEAATTELSTMATTLKIDAKMEQIGGDAPAGQPAGRVTSEKEASKEQIEAVMSKMTI